MPTPYIAHIARPNDGPMIPVNTDKASAAAPKEKKTVSKQKMTAHALQTRESFPQRLMQILSDPNIYDVMRWLPHGRSFIILQTDDLAEKVKKPEVRKYPSFTRKLNRWGFRQVRSGPDAGAFYHHLFIRDEPNLCLQMGSQKGRKDDAKVSLTSPKRIVSPTNTENNGNHQTSTLVLSKFFSPTPTNTSVNQNPIVAEYLYTPGNYIPPSSHSASTPFVHPHAMPTNGSYTIGRGMTPPHANVDTSSCYMPYGQAVFGMEDKASYPNINQNIFTYEATDQESLGKGARNFV